LFREKKPNGDSITGIGTAQSTPTQKPRLLPSGSPVVAPLAERQPSEATPLASTLVHQESVGRNGIPARGWTRALDCDPARTVRASRGEGQSAVRGRGASVELGAPGGWCASQEELAPAVDGLVRVPVDGQTRGALTLRPDRAILRSSLDTVPQRPLWLNRRPSQPKQPHRGHGRTSPIDLQGVLVHDRWGPAFEPHRALVHEL
jgi:hypothetical protein